MQVLKTIWRPFLCAAFFIMGSIRQLPAQPGIAREYRIEAVFIFNFTQFVQWPASAFSTVDAPLVIGVLGENPFGSYLDETVAGEKVSGHPVIVRQFDNPEEVKNCHILFIGQSDPKKPEEVISGLKEKNILTISDNQRFLVQGGMIRFFTRNNNLRFEINLEATKAADLVLSSKLLRLAEIFDPSKNK